jgi:hypothetical protein
MAERRMTDEERDLAEALAQTLNTAAEAQVTVYFESGYQGSIAVRLAWEGRQDPIRFLWRDVAKLLAACLTPEQQRLLKTYTED